MFSVPRLPFREDKVFGLLILSLVIVPLVFYWGLYEKYETIKFSAWLVLLGLAGALFLRKSKIKKDPWLYMGLGLFVFFGLISSFYSHDKINAFLGFELRYTSGFLFYALFATTLFLARQVLALEKWKFAVKVLFGGGVLVSFVGVIQTFGIGYYTGPDQVLFSRAPGLLGNPNFSSMYITALLPFCVPLILQAKSSFAKAGYFTASVLMLASAVIFSSRGAVLAFGVSAVSFFVYWLVVFKNSFKIRILALFSAVMVGTGLLVAFEIVRPGSLVSAVKLSEVNVDLRFFVWDTAREVIQKHPIVGFGPGSLHIYFENYRTSNLAIQSGVFDDAHNLALQMSATTGLPFFAAFLFLIVIALQRGYKELKTNPENMWFLAAMVSMISWGVSSSFTPVSLPCFLLLAVILCGLYDSAQEEKLFEIGTLQKISARLLFLGFVFLGFVLISSEVVFYKGTKAYSEGKFSAAEKYFHMARHMHPFKQNTYLYLTATQIVQNPGQEEVEKNLNKIARMHAMSARTDVMQANLSFLRYDMTGDAKYIEQAILHMQDSIKKDMFFPSRYTHMAFYQAQAGKLEQAKESLKMTLTLDSKNVPGWLLLARIYQLQNKKEQAIFCLLKAKESAPHNQVLEGLLISAESEKDFKQVQIPAFINVHQIEP